LTNAIIISKEQFNSNTMYRKVFILLFLMSLSFYSFSQDKDIQTLYNQATKSLKLFVLKKPLNNNKYDISDSVFYGDYLMRSYNQSIDTKYFLEIIENSKKVDTSDWQDAELPNCILIKDSISLVDKNYVINKFAANKKLLSNNKRETKRFNKHIADRRYYSMSRPVFDNAHQYAVVNISNNYYGGMLLMFKKVNSVWQELGMIDVWRW